MAVPTTRRDSLWMLAISPSIWVAHFLLSYVTAAVWCAKYADASASLGPVQPTIGIYTVVAMLGILATGWLGYRRHSLGSADLPHDDDTPEDRHRFLGFATLLLSALSAVATLFVAAVAYLAGSCH